MQRQRNFIPNLRTVIPRLKMLIIVTLLYLKSEKDQKKMYRNVCNAHPIRPPCLLVLVRPSTSFWVENPSSYLCVSYFVNTLLQTFSKLLPLRIFFAKIKVSYTETELKCAAKLIFVVFELLFSAFLNE